MSLSMTVPPVAPPSKPFSWSYSKLKNFEACAKRHYHVDLVRDFKDSGGESMLWGNEVHKAFELRLKEQRPWPMGMAHYESWAKRVEAMGGTLMVEQNLAITDQFGPTDWFNKRAWFRSKADAIVEKGTVAWTGDWKTGKVLDDSIQLGLVAACIFIHRPHIQAVRSEFAWLKEDSTTPTTWLRGSMPAFWASVLPRVASYRLAYTNTEFPAQPSFLCRNYCPVKSCPHNGR